MFNKIYISVLNTSNESAKEPIVYDLLSLTGIYFPKYDNKDSYKMRNQHHNNHYTVTKITILKWVWQTF